MTRRVGPDAVKIPSPESGRFLHGRALGVAVRLLPGRARRRRVPAGPGAPCRPRGRPTPGISVSATPVAQ